MKKKVLLISLALCFLGMSEAYASFTITNRSGTAFYFDDEDSLNSSYLGYLITNTGSNQDDVWVKIQNFSGPKLSVGTNATDLFHIGPMASGNSQMAYFYVKTSASGNGDSSQTLDETVDIKVYGNYADAAAGTNALSASTITIADQVDTQNASANKVISAGLFPNPPTLGGTFSISVNGNTGTISSAKQAYFTAASQDTWPANKLQVTGISVTFFYNAGSADDVTYKDIPFINLPATTATDYTFTYTFKAISATSSSVSASPTGNITSGGIFKHTTISSFSQVQPILPVDNKLTMTKSANPTALVSGGTTTYTLTFTNSGTSAVSFDRVVDTLPSAPASVTYNTGTSKYNGSSISDPVTSGHTLTWNGLFSVPAASSRTFTFDATVPSTTGVYRNSAVAYIQTDQIDQSSSTADSSPAVIDVAVGNIPNLSNSTKTVSDVNGGTLQPGDTLRYTVQIKDTGFANGTGIHLTDSIDSDTENVTNFTFSGCGSSYTNNSAGASVDVTGLAVLPGAICTVTFDVSVKSAALNGTSITNQASISAANEGGNGATPSSPPVTVSTAPDLSGSTKSVLDLNGGVVAPGDTLRYTVTLINGGGTNGTGITLTDTIDTDTASPTNFTFSNCGSPTNSSTGTAVNVTNLQTAVGTNCVVTFDVSVSASAENNTPIFNQATISAASQGGAGANPASPVQTVKTLADLSTSTKSVSDLNGGSVVPGDTLRYTVNIINNGSPSAANTGISLSDTIDTDTNNLTNFSFTNCGSSYVNSSSGTAVNVTGLQSVVGTACVVTFDASVKAGTANASAVVNTADIASSTAGVLGASPSSTTLTVVTVPNLSSSTKAVSDIDGGSVLPGDTLRYTVEISNTGFVTGTGIRLTDTVDTDTDSIGNFSFTHCGSSYVNNSTGTAVDVTGLQAAVGTNCVVTFDAVVKSGTVNGASVDNRAVIAAAFEGGAGATPNSASQTVVSVPNLSTSTKSGSDINGGAVNPGDTLRYTVSVVNTGAVTATGISLTDIIDSETQNVTNFNFTNCGAGYSNNSAGSTVSVTDLEAAVGTHCVITYDVTVKAAAANGAGIDNDVTISAAAEGGNGAAPSSNSFTVSALPNLSTSTKSGSDVNGGVVNPGDTLRYTVTLMNTGYAAGTGISLSDTIDSDTQNVSNFNFTNCGSSYTNTSSGGSVNVTGLQTSVGTNCVVTYDVTVKPGTANNASVDNAVTISSAAEGGGGATPSSNSFSVVALPDITASTKAVSDINAATVQPNDVLRYTIRLINTGYATGTGIALTDTLDSDTDSLGSFSFTNCGTNYTNSSGAQVNVTGLEVTTSDNCVVTFDVTVKGGTAQGTDIDNQASLSAPMEGGGGADPSSATLTVGSGAMPDLSTSTKTGIDLNGGDVNPGDALRYTVTVINSGAAAGTGISLSDTPDSDTENAANFVFLNCGNAYVNSSSGGAIDVTGLETAVGVNCVITYDVTVKAGTPNGAGIDNDVIISSAHEGGDGASPSSNSFTVSALPNLSTSTKSGADINAGLVKPGDTLRYTVTVINTGYAAGTGISLADTVDSDTNNVANFSFLNCGSYYTNNSSGGSVDVTGIEAAVGTNCVITYDVTVKAGTADGASIDNSVTISGAGEGGNGAAPSSNAFTVTSLPDLSASTKSGSDVNAGTVNPGDTLRYTLTLINSGTAEGTSISISDTIDSDTQNPVNFSFKDCGSAYINNSSGSTVDVTGLQAAVGTDCVITYDVTVKSGTAHGTMIDNGVTISSAGEGGSGAAPSSSSFTVTALPNLSTSTKTGSDLNGGAAEPGDTLRYTVTVINSGYAAATGISLTDTIDSDTQNITNFTFLNCGLNYLNSSSGASVDVAGLETAVGTNCVITYDVAIKSGTANGTSVDNEVTISAASEGGSGAAPSSNSFTVSALPDLSTSKKFASDVNGGSVKPGDTLRYTITIINSGGADGTGIALSDTIDSDTENASNFSFTNCGARYINSSSGADLSVTGLQSAVGLDCVIGYDVAVKASAANGAIIDNQAAISAANEGGRGAAPASNSLTVTALPSLKLLKTLSDVNGGNIEPGDTLTYTLTLTNSGDAASTATKIKDSVPSQTQYVASSTTLNGSLVSDVSGRPPLAAGLTVNTDGQSAGVVMFGASSPVTVTFQVKVNPALPQGTMLTNSAAASSAELTIPVNSDDPDLDGNGNGDFQDDEDATLGVIGSGVKLRAIKTAEESTDADGVAETGDTYQYRVVITNAGNQTATNVSLSDTPDAQTALSVGTVTTTAGAVTGGNALGDSAAEVNIGNLAPGEQALITYRVTISGGVNDGDVISNQAAITSAQTPPVLTDADGNETNGFQPTAFVIGSKAKLELTKKVTDLNGGLVQPGDTLFYSLTLKNTGTVPAEGVTIMDTPDTHTKLATPGQVTASQGNVITGNALNDTSLNIDIGTVAAKASVTVTYSAEVNGNTAEGTPIINTATAADDDPDTDDATETVTVSVGGSPGTASVYGRAYADFNQDGNYDSGEALSGWTVKVQNCSNGAAFSAQTDSEGAYRAVNLPTDASYKIQFYDASGTLRGEEGSGCRTITAGEVEVDQNLRIDPSGFIYDSATGQPLAGATVQLIDTSGTFAAAGSLVPNASLAGPNTLTTDATGFYSFVFIAAPCPAGGPCDYEIRVTPPAGYALSSASPPVANNITAGLLDIAGGFVDAPDGVLVANGNVDDEGAAPFNTAGVNGALFRYSFNVRYTAGETGEVLQNNIPLDPTSSSVLRIVKTAGKQDVSVGDLIPYKLEITSTASGSLSGLTFRDQIPKGFKYVKKSARLDGEAIEAAGDSLLDFQDISIAANLKRTITYVLTVGTGVIPGEYTNTAYGINNAGVRISNIAKANVYVVKDPVFQLSTIIGKVFHDRNGNGIQDGCQSPRINAVCAEEGIPGAKVVSVRGEVMTTDFYGRFHAAGADPGDRDRGQNYILKLDPRSIGNKTLLTTPNPQSVRLTQGLMEKINFGVQFETDSQPEIVVKEKKKENPGRGLMKLAKSLLLGFSTWIDPSVYADEGDNQDIPRVYVAQDRFQTLPKLNLEIAQTLQKSRARKALRKAEFYAYTNYDFFIKKYRLLIYRGRDTEKGVPVKTIVFDHAPTFEPITWDGSLDHAGEIRVGDALVAVLEVEDARGRKDRTSPIDFEVEALDIKEKNMKDSNVAHPQKFPGYGLDNTAKRQIPLKGESVVMHTGGMKPGESLEINGKKIIPDASGNLAYETLISGEVKSLDIRMLNAKGEIKSQQAEQLQIKPEDFFSTGIIDTNFGNNNFHGDRDILAPRPHYGDRTFLDSRVALYTRGKFKDKYRLTAQLDTEEERFQDLLHKLDDRDPRRVFRYLDSDKYYGTYGDESSLDADVDTQGKFFARLEWDKSEILWGNYNTGFTGTELARYNRSLYGGTAVYESMESTKFGDPRYYCSGFISEAKSLQDHNEFAATGGSLFYLKHQNAVEGSAKISVEVRDKNSGRVLKSTPLVLGADYDLDHLQGRILLNEPLSRLAKSSSIISSDVRNGDVVFLVADYEYDPAVGETLDSPGGARSSLWIGQHLQTGATVVHEKRDVHDYNLYGTDATLKFLPKTYLRSEYALSREAQTPSEISVEGGLDFNRMDTGEMASPKGNAYKFEFSSDLREATGNKINAVTEAYYKNRESGFSSLAEDARDNTSEYGGKITSELWNQVKLEAGHASFSQEEAFEEINSWVQLQKKLSVKTNGTLEVRHRRQDEDENRIIPEELEMDNILSLRNEVLTAARLDHQVSDKTAIYGVQQITLFKDADESRNDRTTLGAQFRLSERTDLNLEAFYGVLGFGENAGLTRKVDEQTRVYTAFETSTDHATNRTYHNRIFGTTTDFGDRSQVYKERQFRDYKSQNAAVDVYGIRYSPSPAWTLHGSQEFSRIVQDRAASIIGNQIIDRNTASIGAAYRGEKLNSGTRFELRKDKGTERRTQYVALHRSEYKPEPAWVFMEEAKFSYTGNQTTSLEEASFFEVNAGAAHRPTLNDRLNVLSKYAFLQDLSPAGQRDIAFDERSHVISIEALYDLTPKVGLGSKAAYKLAQIQLERDADLFVSSQTYLFVERVNYRIFKNWTGYGECRWLANSTALDRKQGIVAGIERRLFKHMSLGLGYNFADFNDDLTHLNYESGGWFLNTKATW